MIFKQKRKPGEINRPQSVSVNRYYGSSSRRKKARLKDSTSDGSKKSVWVRTKKITKLVVHSFPVIVIVVLVALNTTLSGVAVRIQGEDYAFRSRSDYKVSVQELINQSVLNKNKLTLNSTKLESNIMEAFPEVSSTTVVVPLAGRVLSVGLKLDSPLLRVTNITNKQGIVGESGRLILLDNPSFVLSSFSSLPSMSIEPTTVDFQLGDLVLTSQEKELISLLIEEFDGLDIAMPKLSSLLFQVDKREIQASFEGKTYFAKLTPERGAREQVGSLIATLEQLSKQGSEPTEYIDVRVEERVFVK